MFTYTWSGDTDPGRSKNNNEDAVLPQGSHQGPGPIAFAVADGLGGGPAGEVASRLAVESVAANATTASSAGDLVAGAHQAVADYILKHIDEDLALVGMATTLTLARLDEHGTLDIGHVGDSRLYLFNSGDLVQLTNDHTVAMDLVRAGELDPADAPDHPEWHTMSNWIGADTARIETRSIQLQSRDRVLVCTDGLSNMIDDDEIAALLVAQPDPEACVRSLIDAANNAGGRDNIGVVLVNVEEE